jgi:multiple antibiotic resistance protein
MNDWSDLFKITVALIAIVNPIGGVPVFISTTQGWTEAERAKTARVVAVSVFCVLAVADLLGTALLELFAISIPSFLVGGGILLMMLAISMLQAKDSWIRQTPAEAQEASEKQAVGVVPIAIPLLAGPGAISTIIIATHQAPGLLYQLKLLIPVGVIALVVWGTMAVASRVARRLGTVGINIVTRLMGLILAAMAVEFVVRGVSELFPKLV